MPIEVYQHGAKATRAELIALALHWSGANAALRAVSRSHQIAGNSLRQISQLRKSRSPRFVILCYHRVGTDGVPFYSALDPRKFEDQMRYISRYYRVLSLDQMYDELYSGGAPMTGVVVTFDDGYRDTYVQAFPILRKYRIPATVYLTAGCIETAEVAWYDRIFLALQTAPAGRFEVQLDTLRAFALGTVESRVQAAIQINFFLRTVPDATRIAYCKDLEARVELPQSELSDRMLSWEQVREMNRAGIHFAAHTMTHPVVSQLTEAQARAEIVDSKQLIEKTLSVAVRHFAFPFGKFEDCGTVAPAILAQAGFVTGTTTEWGFNTPVNNPFLLRRVQVNEQESLALFALRLNQAFLTGDCGPGPAVAMEQENTSELVKS